MTHPRHLHVVSSQATQTVVAPPDQAGLRISELLRRHGLPLNTRCGQKAICDGCFLELTAGSLVDMETGKLVTVDGASMPVMIRGCTHRLPPALAPGGNAIDGATSAGSATSAVATTVRVPDRSLCAYEPQVLTDFALKVPFAHDPIWQPGSGEAPPALPTLGAAVDVGTTTVAVLLVDLATGKVLSRASGFNRQMHLGDDVLTRINLCFSDVTQVSILQEAIVAQTLRPLIDQALRQADAQASQLKCIVAAGNTTMQHLLAGVDPSSMGMSPFTPVFLDHRTHRAAELGLRLARHEPHAADNVAAVHDPVIHLLPGAAAYIGADLTAGIIASGLLYDDGPSLLLDVGTNGEIVLKMGDKLWGCATAAGPAFEGAGLIDGIRAGEGAISHIALEKDPFSIDLEVIGDATPLGICGSAYIDFLAEGLRCDLLNASGRFNIEAVGPDMRKHIEKGEEGKVFRLARGRGSAPIVVAEADISRLLQAKAAIAAGLLTLLNRAGLVPGDVRRLYLAGGFGMHVDIDNAIAAGLLPGFQRSQIELVGNTSLGGAMMAMLDRSVLTEIAQVGSGMEVVELNTDPAFEDHYIDQLMLA